MNVQQTLKAIGLACCIVFSAKASHAQTAANDSTRTTRERPKTVGNVLDGAYRPTEAHRDFSELMTYVVPFPTLREADVFYKKRIWQEIDLRQKFNHPYYYPTRRIADRVNMFDAILDAIFYMETGKELTEPIQVFKAGPEMEGDEFSKLLTPEDVRELLIKKDSVKVTDDFGIPVIPERWDYSFVRLDPATVTRWKIKEDWIWDRQRSERTIRIIGLCPMAEEEVAGQLGYTDLFWIPYNNATRRVLASEFAYNPLNDAARRSFDELLVKRYFSSYIVKEDNAADRMISQYALGVAAIAEAERIKEGLFNLEHDMWNY
jgi:gliding motility associated protien GldN